MDVPGTVFYLIPSNRHAREIVADAANSDRVCMPDFASDPCLRIGLDQQRKTGSHLVRFGRHERNDVRLGNRFSRNDQCYFDFNRDTGELMLHDISENGDTLLYELGKPDCMRKKPRQCAVVLSCDPYDDNSQRNWVFRIRSATFELKPRKVHDNQSAAAFMNERIMFAGKPDPEQTLEGTIERLITLGLQSQGLTTTYLPSTVVYNPHNTRFKTALQPEEDNMIRYLKLGVLGKGGQGEVHKVVDMYNGNHYACKVIAVKVDRWSMASEKDFRRKVEREVIMVQQIQHHANIVPYIYTQGYKIGQDIEIFMPVYEGALKDLVNKCAPGKSRPDVRKNIAGEVLRQMLDALDFVHTRNPPIIHRDVKPANILYRGDKFFLADFGIAKKVDSSSTIIGSTWYMAPEVSENGVHTPKVDIFSLGVTILECLEDFIPESKRSKEWPQELLWHEHIRMSLSKHEPRAIFMLAHDAEDRPTAGKLLSQLFDRALPQHSQVYNTPQIMGESSNLTNQASGAANTHSDMDWTQSRISALFHGFLLPSNQDETSQPLEAEEVVAESSRAASKRPAEVNFIRARSLKSASSADNGTREGHRRGSSSKDERPGPSRPVGISKRPSTSRRRRTKSKSTQEDSDSDE